MKVVYVSAFSLLLFAFACGGVPEYEHEKLQDELTSTKVELSTSNDDLTASKSSLESIQAQLTDAEAELNQAKVELETLKSSYDDLRANADDTVLLLELWKSDLEVSQALSDSGIMEALLMGDDSFFENITEEQMMQFLSITQDSLYPKELDVNNQKLAKALKNLDQEWDKLGVSMMFSDDSPIESLLSELGAGGLSSSDVAIYEILIDMLKE